MERNVFTAEQEKWLKALESGQYRQCKEFLHDKGAHCCLGVADIVCGLGESSGTELSGTYKVLHLRSPNGRFDHGIDIMRCDDMERIVTLIGLNDDVNYSFAQIAAFIRANPWQVFTNFDAPVSS